jgi:hypothetical protein
LASSCSIWMVMNPCFLAMPIAKLIKGSAEHQKAYLFQWCVLPLLLLLM